MCRALWETFFLNLWYSRLNVKRFAGSIQATSHSVFKHVYCTIAPVFRVQSIKTGECVSTHKSFIRRVQLITTGHRVMSLLNRGVKSMQNSRNKLCIRETNYKLLSTLMHRIMVVMDVFRTFYEQIKGLHHHYHVHQRST